MFALKHIHSFTFLLFHTFTIFQIPECIVAALLGNQSRIDIRNPSLSRISLALPEPPKTTKFQVSFYSDFCTMLNFFFFFKHMKVGKASGFCLIPNPKQFYFRLLMAWVNQFRNTINSAFKARAEKREHYKRKTQKKNNSRLLCVISLSFSLLFPLFVPLLDLSKKPD